VLTSKVMQKVMVAVGSAKRELHANEATLLPVPAGTNRVTFSQPGGVSCSVTIDVPANMRRSLVFGPPLDFVAVRGSSGVQRLRCQRP
jgi:hypothetical protein